jgi:hypothetical protein
MFRKAYWAPTEASFLNGFLHLRGELAPTQRWHSAELVPMRKLAPMLVLKNCPQASNPIVEHEI